MRAFYKLLSTFFLLASALCAANYTVTTLSDEDDGNLLVGNGAGTSLREALAYSANGDTIDFAAALNDGTLELSLGQLELTHGLVIDASSLSDGITITRAPAADEFRLLHIINSPEVEDALVSISNVTVTGGYAVKGGAIYSVDMLLSFNECHFADNFATLGEDEDQCEGGAIYSDYDLSSLENRMTMSDCSFLRNTTASKGGAIFYAGRDVIQATRCSFSQNQAEDGGAIYTYDVVFDFESCVFTENDASRYGGAIHCTPVPNGGQMTNTQFLGNTASYGGGIYLWLNQATIRYTNCLFSGNEAFNTGGAIYQGTIADFGLEFATEYTNCTFAYNVAASKGGAIANDGILSHKLQNCILWGNTAGSDAQVSATYSGTHNHIEGVDSATDPLFVRTPDAGDGDWTTSADNDYGDLTVQQHSPVIGIGDATLNSTSRDLASNPRIVGQLDLGAYEYDGLSFTVMNSDDDGAGSLRRAIENSTNGSVIGFDAALQGSTLQLQSSIRIESDLTVDATMLGEKLQIEGASIFYVDYSDVSTPLEVTLRGLEMIGSGNGQAIYSYGNLTLDQCRFTGFSWAAVYVDAEDSSKPAYLNAENCEFYENGDYGDNGFVSAISYEGRGALSLMNSVFSGNRSGYGGAVSSLSAQSVEMINCSFASNRAESSGGALYLSRTGTPNELINCTFVSNLADNGGALILSGGALQLTNCVFWGNLATDSDPQISGSYTGSDNWIEGVNGATDPLFSLSPDAGDGAWDTLSDNHYGDLRLAPASPLLDAGDGADSGSSANSSITDLFGNPRFIDAKVDIGAHERLTAITVENANDSGDGSLRDALSRISPEGTVTFDPSLSGGEIELSSEGLEITSALQLDASSLAEGITVTRASSAGALRLLTVDDGQDSSNLDVTIDSIAFKNGYIHGSTAGISNRETLSIWNCHFADNHAGNGNGAGVYNYTHGELFLGGCSFTENYTRYYGSGVYNSGTVTAENCLFADNNSDSFGGGFANAGSATSSLVNCAFVNNYAKNRGGAYSNRNASSSELVNCSFSNNHCMDTGSSTGGAVSHDSTGTNTMTNNILWGNSASISPEVYGAYSGSHNLIKGVDSAQDPLFADPLAELRLLSGSPAIGAGDNATNLQSTDLAGATRIQAGVIDLGAYEGSFSTFAHLYPGLGSADDANANGVSNFLDYAQGVDPTAQGTPSLPMLVANNQLQVSVLANAADVNLVIEKSSTLVSDSWVSMVPGTDYVIGSEVTTDGKTLTIYTMQAPILNSESMFFRANYGASQ